jgi:glycosyltransferase involved in cell wall biosynthesis
VVGADRVLSPEDARNRLGLAQEDVVLGVTGRLHPVKEPMRALRAVAALPPGLREVARLVFIGDGPEAPALRKAAQRLQVDIRMPGHMADARALVRGFDVLVSPSRFESFGLSMAEAATAGVPVAAVASPGARLLSEDGALFPLARANPRALAAGIVGALNRKPDQTTALIEATLSRFGPNAAAAAYRSYYEHLLARR